MHTASASGLGQPRATSRRDQTGAMTTSAAVADTDSAKPTSTASCGRTRSSAPITVADKRRNRLPCGGATAPPAARSRPSPRPATRWPSAARRSTNATSASAGQHDRDPRADQRRGEQHRPADDRHVGARTPRSDASARGAKLAAGLSRTPPRCRRAPGRAASPPGRRAARREPRRRTGRGPGGPPAGSAAASPERAAPRSPSAPRRVRSRRFGRPIRARKRSGLARRQLARSRDQTRKRLPGPRHFGVRRAFSSVPRNISRPPPSQRGVSLGGDDHGGDARR